MQPLVGLPRAQFPDFDSEKAAVHCMHCTGSILVGKGVKGRRLLRAGWLNLM